MTASRISRRAFLLGTGAAGLTVAGGSLAAFLAGSSSPSSSSSASPSGADPAPAGGAGPLVVVTLYGGNDGLNTLVPYNDPAYHAARPNLGYSPSEVLTLDADFGLNPKLTGFHSLWQQGKLAVVRGVGYDNPNLSHFASMAIWQTANPPEGTGVGWLGRWLDLTGDDPLQAISVGATMPLLMRGEKQSATAVNAPTITLPGNAAFQSAFTALAGAGSDRSGVEAAVAGSDSDLLSARAALERLRGVVTPAPTSTTGKPGTDLASQLATVAALIQAGAPTRVYHVSLSSFDTHAGEKADQERLLAELDSGVSGFLQQVGSHGVTVMTYSEFGRRPAENASGGTDHGAASVLFVAGPAVKGGRYYGEQPSLTALDSNGNLVHNVDFRSVYATVLERVVGVDSKAVLGGSFPILGFI